MHAATRISLLLSLLLPVAVLAADMAAGSDHPSLPRVAGSEIYGYESSDYDAGNFLTAGADGKMIVHNEEGARTRILYLAQAGDTSLKVQRNYESALTDLGEVTEIFKCSNSECTGHILATTLWTRDSMPPTENLPHPFYLLGFAHAFTSPHYRYAQVAAGDTRYHIGVFSAVLGDNNSNQDVRGRTAALVEIIEVKEFNPTLEFVDASEMQAQISESGHVALYGIQFDHDKATLKADSTNTLAEIAKILSANGALNLYVVGHTDDVGALDYNQALSLRRAKTVVDALVESGVERARLTPLGAGPVAPIGSNDTQEGRALNRRVELVKRSSAN